MSAIDFSFTGEASLGLHPVRTLTASGTTINFDSAPMNRQMLLEGPAFDSLKVQ